MIKSILFLFLATFPILLLPQEIQTSIDNIDKANYLIGYNEGVGFKKGAYVLDFLSLKQGILDGYENKVPNDIEEKRAAISEKYVQWILDKSTNPKATLSPNQIQTFSYLVGVSYGKDFKNKYFSLKGELFIQGIKDAINEKDSLYEEGDTSILKDFYAKAESLKIESSNNKNIELVQDKRFNRPLPKGITYSLISVGKKPLSPGPKSEVTIEYSLAELKDDRLTNINNKQKETIPISRLAEGVQISVLSLQEGEHSIFKIPSLLLFNTSLQKDQTGYALLDITLVSIHSGALIQKKIKTQEAVDINIEPLATKGLLPSSTNKSKPSLNARKK